MTLFAEPEGPYSIANSRAANDWCSYLKLVYKKLDQRYKKITWYLLKMFIRKKNFNHLTRKSV